MAIIKFSEISYEFYMLQFYFINGGFKRLFGDHYSLLAQIIISFLITFVVAFVLAEIGKRLRLAIDLYFIQ